MISSSKTGLLHDLVRRVKVMLWFKTFGGAGFMVLFFCGYIYILRHAVFPVTAMPLLAVDQWISYHNSAWLLYVSLWLYVQVPVTMMESRWELVRYGVAATAISAIGFAFFIFWPTAVPPVVVEGDGALLSAVRSIDTTGNSCPSLHVAFSVFTALWLDRFVRRIGGAGWMRWANVVWCLAIVYSTLATKQHVVLDALAGTALGYVGGWVQARCGGEGRTAASSSDFAQTSPAARKL